jgi:hypothetical protein
MVVSSVRRSGGGGNAKLVDPPSLRFRLHAISTRQVGATRGLESRVWDFGQIRVNLCNPCLDFPPSPRLQRDKLRLENFACSAISRFNPVWCDEMSRTRTIWNPVDARSFAILPTRGRPSRQDRL